MEINGLREWLISFVGLFVNLMAVLKTYQHNMGAGIWE